MLWGKRMQLKGVLPICAASDVLSKHQLICAASDVLSKHTRVVFCIYKVQDKSYFYYADFRKPTSLNHATYTYVAIFFWHNSPVIRMALSTYENLVDLSSIINGWLILLTVDAWKKSFFFFLKKLEGCTCGMGGYRCHKQGLFAH